MKKISKKFVLTGTILSCLMSFAAVTNAVAEDKPEADLTVAAYSKYMWRGQELSDDSIVIQPSMTVAYKGFGFNLWGNFDTNLVGTDRGKWNETDMTISYDGSAGMVSYGVGWIYYGLDAADDSQDIYGTISLDTILAPTLTVYRDITGLDVTYYTLGISHSLAINDKISLDLGAQASYLVDDDNDYKAMHDGILSAALPIAVNEYITISPELYYVFALSSDAETAMQASSQSGTDDKFFYGGLAASFAF